MIMKRVKRHAMFRPSWKFEGKLHSIPPQFFVLCFRVFLGGLRFRGLRFLGGLRFRGLRFLGGLHFRGLRFLGGLRFRGLRFLGGLRFRGLRFLGGLCFRGLRFLGGLPFRGLRFLGGLPFRGLRFLGGLRFRGLRFLGGLSFRGLRFLGGLPFRGLWSSVFGLRFLDTHILYPLWVDMPTGFPCFNFITLLEKSYSPNVRQMVADINNHKHVPTLRGIINYYYFRNSKNYTTQINSHPKIHEATQGKEGSH